MNLLGAVLYDPAAAVSKVTTSLLAMTALDTTNLRVAVTVPAHGRLFFRLSGVHHGSTTTAQLLLGVLNGSTVLGRQPAQKNLLGTAIATTQVRLDAEFAVTGLTPGAMNLDAAYGVEIVSSAGGAIKYGGPNNTTTNDAFGGFSFEVWDPSPNPTNFGLLSIDANGRLDIIKVAGTTQTARDLGAQLDAAVSTRLATAGYTAPLDAAGTRTAVGLASANLDTQLTTIDDFLDTEIAAIKAKTDNLPASPSSLDAAGVRTAIGLASANLDTQLDALPTAAEVRDSVWAKTISASLTALQAFKVIAGLWLGKLSGARTGTVTLRDVDDTQSVIVADVDSSGNRDNIVITPP